MFEPYGFQEKAIIKFTQPKITSRLLGDDMGLGKTPTAMWIDKKNRQDDYKKNGRPAVAHKTLIIASQVVLQDAWLPWIKNIAPNARVVICNPKNRAAFVRALKDPGVHYYLIHWEGMRLVKELRDIKWFHIIADEAHRIKNRKAQLAIALKVLKTRFKTALTGTPADDKPPDIWSILNWLWPEYYRSYWKFVGHYCIFETTDNYGNSPVYRKFVGVQNVASFHKEIEPWYIRRLKEDVLDDLPDKYYSTVWVDLTPAQRKAYDKMKEDMIVWLGDQNDQVMVAPVIIAQLTRLQQFALATMDWDEVGGTWRMCDPSAKLDALMQIIQGNPGEPIVVFTQFKTMVRLLEQRLAKAKISCAALTGDVNQADRGALINGFQKGEYQIFVATIATGSEGITLTKSSTVVFLDRSWKPSANKQAEDRCHRIGQKNAVQIIDLMAKDTVDMGRKQHIENKLAFIKQMLGEL